MIERYYIDEECQMCGAESGTRLCDDCKEELRNQLFDFLDGLIPEARDFLSGEVDGVWLSDWYYRMKETAWNK